jgi:hypothetical protein
VTPFIRLSLEEHADLKKLRADFPRWVFSAVPGRWVAEWRMADGLIVIQKPGPRPHR